MNVLSQVNRITRAVKNVGRFRFLVGVFAKHGFADRIKRTHLSSFVPKQISRRLPATDADQPYARLRRAFEEAGPTFIKLGQMLASRPDLLPVDLVEEMKKLQDSATPFPFKDVEKIIEAELKQPLQTFFAQVDASPLAAASISQVHAARTRDGKDVVLKVQRPHIQKEVRTDMEILLFISQWLEDRVPEVRVFSPSLVVREFTRTLKEELDFRIEANNLRRIRQNLSSFEGIAVPEVESGLSTARLLTMERFHGNRIDDVKNLQAQNVDLKKTVQTGMDAFLHMVLMDGLFHADLHPGNVLMLTDGRIGLIDFGSVGRLSQRIRDQLTQIFLALFSEDYENLALGYLDLIPPAAGHIDLESFQKDLADTLSPYYGMNIKELDAGKVLMESSAVAIRHHLRLPRDLILLFRALITVQAMTRALDPEFDIVQAASKHIKSVLAVRYSPDRLISDGLLFARNSLELIQGLPQQLRLLIRRLFYNQIEFQQTFSQLPEIKETFSRHSLLRTYLFSGIFLLFTGQIKLDSQIEPVFLGLSLFVWLPWALAAVFFGLATWTWLRISN